MQHCGVLPVNQRFWVTVRRGDAVHQPAILVSNHLVEHGEILTVYGIVNSLTDIAGVEGADPSGKPDH